GGTGVSTRGSGWGGAQSLAAASYAKTCVSLFVSRLRRSVAGGRVVHEDVCGVVGIAVDEIRRDGVECDVAAVSAERPADAVAIRRDPGVVDTHTSRCAGLEVVHVDLVVAPGVACGEVRGDGR